MSARQLLAWPDSPLRGLIPPTRQLCRRNPNDLAIPPNGERLACSPVSFHDLCHGCGQRLHRQIT